VPRAGLSTAAVIDAGATLADEVGMAGVSFAALAERLGVRPPALYKHVQSVDDLRHGIATLAMNDLAETLRDNLQGRSGSTAVGALFDAVSAYIDAHPGRYEATTIARLEGVGDPLVGATSRVIDSVRAVLAEYGLAVGEVDHAVRTVRCLIQGYASLRAADAFQWSNDPDESMDWMVRFIHAGLVQMGRAHDGDAVEEVAS